MSVHKPQRPEDLRDVKSWTVSRLPDDCFVIRACSLRTEEIDSERIAGGGGASIYRGVATSPRGDAPVSLCLDLFPWPSVKRTLPARSE